MTSRENHNKVWKAKVKSDFFKRHLSVSIGNSDSILHVLNDLC